MIGFEKGRLVRAVRFALALAVPVALIAARWSTAYLAALTLALSFLPALFERHLRISLPLVFFVWIVLFVFGTLFLGEVFDFYERYWWWDILLHGGSAIGFGLAGFLFVFMLFEGDRFAAPPLAIAFIAFCFAVSIGVAWEIFEFGMDRLFGMTMQKSGLVDTMGDLIVDCIGASIGAWAGYFYLKGWKTGWLSHPIRDFVRLNRGRFGKFRDGAKRAVGKSILSVRRTGSALASLPPKEPPYGPSVEHDGSNSEKNHPKAEDRQEIQKPADDERDAKKAAQPERNRPPNADQRSS